MHVNTSADDVAVLNTSILDDTTALLEKSAVAFEEPQPHWKNKFLFVIERRHGISNSNVAVYFVLVICMVVGLMYISVTNQMVLQTYAKVPRGAEGRAAGDLTFYTEVVMLFMSWIWGSLSDTMGSRKFVFVISFAILSISVVLQPMADSFNLLLCTRLLFGVGVSGLLGIYLATVADYTVEKDRGKATGLIGLSLNVGSLITSFILANIPLWISTYTILTEIQAGYISFAIVGLIFILAAIFAAVFLHDGEIYRKLSHHERVQEEDSIVKAEDKKSFIRTFSKTFLEGITAMKNPVIILAYIAAFVSRMDISTTTFTSLWISQSLIEKGVSQASALGQVGFITGIATMLSILTAPTLGLLGDRVNRVLLLCIISLFACFSFGATYLLPADITEWWVYPWTASMQASNAGVLLCSNILVTQAAPKASRGSVMGVYMLMAAVGVMVSTKTGGILFDIDHSYPYLVVALCNSALFGLSVLALLYQSIQWYLNRKKGIITEIEEETPEHIIISH